MATDSKQPIGHWLRAAREKRNVTEAELAKHLGTEQSMLAMVERGEANPSPALHAKISDWIQNGHRPGPPPKRGAYAK